MIVTCQRCATQFQLDDSRVSAKGIRVRCSRCKHAFFIGPDGRSERGLKDEQVDRLVRAALEEAPPEVPEVARDLSTPASAETAPEPAGSPSEEGPGEADWQFNDDSSFEAVFGECGGDLGEPEELAAAREAVDGLLGASADPLRLSEDPEPVPPGPEELAPPLGAEEAREERRGSEDWDASLDGPPASEVAERSESGGLEGSTPGAGADRELAAATGHAASASPAVAGVEEEPSPLQIRLRRAAEGLGWAAVAALVLMTLHGGLRSTPAPAAGLVGVQEAAGMAVEVAEARWIENAVAGPIYLVSGTLRGTGSRRSAARELPALRPVDASGVAVSPEPVPLGAPLPERALRERDPRELAADLSRVRRLTWPPPGPGEVRPFQALFTELPGEATGLELDAIPAPVLDPPAAETGAASVSGRAPRDPSPR